MCVIQASQLRVGLDGRSPESYCKLVYLNADFYAQI